MSEYVMVPREPTEAMIEAALIAGDAHFRSLASDTVEIIWQAALSAAPAQTPADLAASLVNLLAPDQGEPASEALGLAVRVQAALNGVSAGPVTPSRVTLAMARAAFDANLRGFTIPRLGVREASWDDLDPDTQMRWFHIVQCALDQAPAQTPGREEIKRGLINSAGQLATVVHGAPDAAEAAMDIVADRILALLEPRP